MIVVRRRNAGDHQGYSIPRQAVGQEFGELAIPVRNVTRSLLGVAQRGDAVTQNHEALVDVISFLQRFSLTHGLLGQLTASKVHKVDLSVLGEEHPAIGLLIGQDVNRQDGVRARGVIVHGMRANSTIPHAYKNTKITINLQYLLR